MGKSIRNKFSEKIGSKKNSSTELNSLIRGRQDVVESFWIPTEEIYSRAQVRTVFNEDEIVELAATLKGRKQRQAITLYPQNKEGKYCIYIGERRWRAAALNGEPVLAYIDDSLEIDEQQTSVRIIDQLVENVARKDLNALDLGKAFADLRAEGVNNREIAASLGKSDAWVSKHLKLVQMPDFVQYLFDSKIVTNIETLNILTDCAAVDEDTTRNYIEEIKQSEGGLSRSQAQLFCDRLTGKKPAPLPETNEDQNQSVTFFANIGDKLERDEFNLKDKLNIDDEFSVSNEINVSGGLKSGDETDTNSKVNDETTIGSELNISEKIGIDVEPSTSHEQNTKVTQDINSFNVFEGETEELNIYVLVNGEEWILCKHKKSIVHEGEVYVFCSQDGFEVEIPINDCQLSRIG
ncbi:ParB/RepB/Spo0J family partition protein [Xenorhabdus nematophila]|uniref:ParB/RepB/Spo0J family partition protein n=1 Tax=Xenorhabdus nematophila TaxID=628 RepID=UPI0032B795D0